MTTLGTHNLLDGAAPATPFADVLFFTEAHPLDGDLKMYEVWVAPKQRDLSICFRPSVLALEDVKHHYKRALPFSVKKVTPNRGTFWLTGVVGEEKVALLVEHRINAAFPPYKRGEGLFRRLGWETHARLTLRIIRRLKNQGYTIYAGGDLNTPRGVSGYRKTLNEVGQHFDRLGSTERLRDVEVLSRMGSDHNRLKATA